MIDVLDILLASPPFVMSMTIPDALPPMRGWDVRVYPAVSGKVQVLHKLHKVKTQSLSGEIDVKGG